MKLRFSILRDYSYIKRYAVRTKSFIEKLTSAFKPKKKVEEVEVKKVEEEKVQVKGSDILIAKVLPVLILLGFIGFLYLKFTEFSTLLSMAGQVQPISFMASQKFAHFINSGTLTNKGAAFLQSLELANASTFSVSPLFLNFPLSGDVAYFYDSNIQSTFAENVGKGLESRLRQLGFSFTFISSLEQAEKLSPGSIVIFPSDSLVPGFTQAAPKLAAKGVIIFIISKDPNFELSSSLLSKPVSVFWINEGVSFQLSDKSVPELNLNFISYEVEGATTVKGGAQYIQTKTGMRTLFLPASLGKNALNYWEDESKAVEDITSIIEEFVLLSSRKETVTYSLTNDSIIYVNFPAKGQATLPLSFDVLTVVEAKQSKKYIFSSVEKDFPGEAYFQQPMPILPYKISNRESLIRFQADPKEEGTARVKMLLLDDDGVIADEVALNSLEPLQKSVPFDFSYSNTSLKEGRYLVLFKDADTGEIYAKSVLELGTLNISAKPDFDKAQINFTFLVSGRPTYVGRATIRYGNIEKTFSNVRTAVLDLSDVFKGSMPAGEYVFEVEVEGSPEPLTVSLRRASRTGLTTFFTKPLNLFILFLAVALRLVGEVLKRREELPYSIDVPDFAPVEYETIEISKKEMLRVFDVVNEFYKWELTPLNLEEIKKGISLILNKESLVLNDFNLEIVLEQLVSEGLIIHIRDYYLPRKWLDKGFTAEQLVSYRMLRDVCVDLAIPFKKLSKSLPNTVLYLPWEEFWIYLYSPYNKEKIKSAIIKNYPKEGMDHVIVFFDEDDLDKFKLSLNDVSFVSSLLKSYMDNGKIYLFTIDALVDTLKEVKS